MIVAPYIRVSTQEQVEHGYSIEEQSKRTKKYCESMGWDIYKIYSDPGYSGGNTDRPGLKLLIDDVEAGKIDKVLVYKLDRLSRSQLDTLYLIEKIFLANNTDFVSMSENFDTSTPFGRAMIGILAVFAQLEREQIKERMKLGKDARAKQGKFHGSSNTPVGYDYINGELITNDYEKMQVQTVFELSSKGHGGYYITKYMNSHGYKHKYGEWNPMLVKRELRNKTYLGYIRHIDKYYKGQHEAFIDENLFESVQKDLDQRKSDYLKYNRRPGKVTTYLGGLLVCGKCGAKYAKNTDSPKKKNGGRYIYERYSCNSRTKKYYGAVKDPNCKNKHWMMDELNNIIFDEIRKLAYDNTLNMENTPDERPGIIQKEIEKLDKNISRLIDLYTDEMISKDALQDKIKALDEHKKNLNDELKLIKEDPKLSKQDATALINSFDEILKHGDFETIRTVLSQLIEKIVLNDDEVTIYWRFS